MDITAADRARRLKYLKTKPKHLGNLHERMQLVMELAQTAELYKTNNELWGAIHDLQVEVSYLKPASPPYGRRTQALSEYVG